MLVLMNLRKYLSKTHFQKCNFNTCSSNMLSNEKLNKIKEFRKITNLSIGICKNILNKNDYNIVNSINYIFQNFNTNYEKKDKKLAEGFYCFTQHENVIGLTELNCYNDLISENIHFKELLINLCNNLTQYYINKKDIQPEVDKNTQNVRKIQNDSFLHNKVIYNYIPLYYKSNNIINVDKKLENISDINIFKEIYFNRSLKQLINYTSFILNDFIFFRNYFLIYDMNKLLSNRKNMHIIKKYYYHKEVNIENFILCKGFSFTFLFIESNKNLDEFTELLLEKLSYLICINILIYKSKHCSKDPKFFDIHSCLENKLSNLSKNEINNDNNNLNKENTVPNEIYINDIMTEKIQSFEIISQCLNDSNNKNFKLHNTDNITFIELFNILENELQIKIFPKIIYSMINEDLVIL
ncbi:conserved Plasmodium protein, unknown function [Plasmodium sp. gorilla clade G2]|uniref:conserved Plasmodium protein, unknown function n=1 Tax=Plasmodium sp. gorilla clade G2 TaxID=880535 RepID=UPI000D210D11|nr:conserved Plasmodium protein, unknown function [Plasmodium sp. gorilla clade G2]SOV19350.1 conserved Plasmodium protein, unknown function [Plasmodium sp. gorilla clade G2]